MNFKTSFLLSIFAASLFFISAGAAEAAAQTRQRLSLRPARGEAGKAVAGRVRSTLRGAVYRDYFFSIPEGRSIDISVTTDAGAEVKFDVLSPKGEKLFSDTSEILDELPSRGTYTIRVYRTTDAEDKGGTSRFQLSVFMYI